MSTPTPIKYKLGTKLKDESFNIDELQAYNLYLNIGLDSFEFCVVNNTNNRCVLLEEYELNGIPSYDELLVQLKQIWESHHILKVGFWKKIRVSYKNQQFTMIPSSLFTKENRKDYLNATSDMSELSGVSSYKHISFNGVNVFAFPENIQQFLDKTYPKLKVEITHLTSCVIEATFRGKFANEGKTILLNVSRKHIEVVVTDNGKLLFCNRFQYTSSEDFIYFIMLTYKELELNSESDKILIFGEIAPNSPLYEVITKYIRHSGFGKRPKFLNFSYHFDEIFDHRCFSTYAIHLCE